MSQAKTTTQHKTIRQWAEERGGRPATVRDTSLPGEAGLLRIDFPGSSEESLEGIDWDEFFDKFEEKHLAFLYQDKTDDGQVSRFCKFIERES